MGLILFALRRPITVMVAVMAIALGCGLAINRMAVDIFPSLNLPVIYVAQPYGGMDPAQMEGLLTNYYEYHFLYISGIHHVESKNVQGTALMKLYFHPGTDMAQAMAETINYVNRARAFMPPGTVSPFVMRFDTGSVPVGYLVLSSESRSLAEIQDLALFRVRPMFASLPGVSAPPPFGGSARSIVVRLEPDLLRSYRVTPDEVITALTQGNTISPSGNLHIGDNYPIVPLNSMVRQIDELGSIPIRTGVNPAVYLSQIAQIEDSMDIATGYALVNGRRAIYMLVTKRADASTLNVINAVKAALPKMQDQLPSDVHVRLEFDQSPYVTRSMWGLATEGALGAVLTGLMVLIFLRDWRSALVVVLNIPLALVAAVVALWLSGQTINLMTLGGLALAIGILVDEATVEVENIHSQFEHTPSIARAVRLGNAQTAIPRLLAMLCILAVFLPSFFMQGAARALFVPLSLGGRLFDGWPRTCCRARSCRCFRSGSCGTSSIPTPTIAGASWLETAARRVCPAGETDSAAADRLSRRLSSGQRRGYRACRRPVGHGDLSARRCGTVSPAPAGQDGTHFAKTEQIALEVLQLIKEKAGAGNVDLTLGYVGTIPSSYPINAVYQWSRGPEEAILLVSLKPGSHVDIERLEGRAARRTWRRKCPTCAIRSSRPTSSTR